MAFQKTHDVEALIGSIPPEVRRGLKVEEVALLSEYAVGPRYPGWRSVSLSEARKAVASARRIRNTYGFCCPGVR